MTKPNEGSPPSSPRLTAHSIDDDINAAPLHLHAIKYPARLQGMPQNITTSGPGAGLKAMGSSSRSSSRSRSSRPTSRDPSPSPSDHAVTSMSSRPSSSSSSLVGDINESFNGLQVDPDIFLDKHGLEELELDSHASGHSNISSTPALKSVNERMSEDSLDDCHAFTDLRNVIRQNIGSGGSVGGGSDSVRSRDGSVTGGSVLGDSSCLLETLEEFEDESEEDDEEDMDVDRMKKLKLKSKKATIKEQTSESPDEDADNNAVSSKES